MERTAVHGTFGRAPMESAVLRVQRLDSQLLLRNVSTIAQTLNREPVIFDTPSACRRIRFGYCNAHGFGWMHVVVAAVAIRLLPRRAR